MAADEEVYGQQNLVAPVYQYATTASAPTSIFDNTAARPSIFGAQSVGNVNAQAPRTFQQLVSDPTFLSSAYNIRKEMFDNWYKNDAPRLLQAAPEKERPALMAHAQSEFNRIVPPPAEGWKVGNYVGLAAEGLGSSLAAVGDLVSPDNAVSSALRTGGQWVGDTLVGTATRERQLENQQRLAAAQGTLGKAGEVVRDIWQNPLERFSSAAGSAAPMVAAGVATGGLGAAVLGGAMNVGDVRYHRYQQAQALTDEQLRANPETAQLLAAGWTPQQVRDQLANDVGLPEALAGAAGAVPGGFFGRLGGNLAGGATRNVVGRLGTALEGRGGTALEGVLAAGIGAGGAQVGRNIADQQQGRDVGTWNDVVPVALAAGIPGGVIGAGLHSGRAVDRVRTAREQAADRAAREPFIEPMLEAASAADIAARQAYVETGDAAIARDTFRQRLQELAPKTETGEFAAPHIEGDIAAATDRFGNIIDRYSRMQDSRQSRAQEQADLTFRDAMASEPVFNLAQTAPPMLPGETMRAWMDRAVPRQPLDRVATTALARLTELSRGESNATTITDVLTGRSRADAGRSEGAGTLARGAGDTLSEAAAGPAADIAAANAGGVGRSDGGGPEAAAPVELRPISARAANANGDALAARAAPDTGINRNAAELPAGVGTDGGLPAGVSAGTDAAAPGPGVRPGAAARGGGATDQGATGIRSGEGPAGARLPSPTEQPITTPRVTQSTPEAARAAADVQVENVPSAKSAEVARNLGTPEEAATSIATAHTALTTEQRAAVYDRFARLPQAEQVPVRQWAIDNGTGGDIPTAVALASAAKTQNATAWRTMGNALKRTFDKLMRGVMVALAYFSLTHAPVPRDVSGAQARPLVQVEQTVRARATQGEVRISVEQQAPSRSPSLDNMYENRVNQWVQETGDNRNAPYIIVNKGANPEKGGLAGEPNLKVMAPDGSVIAQTKVLTGKIVGDETRPGQTPAGRFTARQQAIEGPTYGGDVRAFAQQGQNLFAIHRVVTTQPSEQRVQRLNSQRADDTRVSMGCINVPLDFYNQHFAGQPDMRVYVIPDSVQAMGEFGGLQAPLPPQRPADLGASVPGDGAAIEPVGAPTADTLAAAARSALEGGAPVGLSSEPTQQTPIVPGAPASATAPARAGTRRRREAPRTESKPTDLGGEGLPQSPFVRETDAEGNVVDTSTPPAETDMPRPRIDVSALTDRVTNNALARNMTNLINRAVREKQFQHPLTFEENLKLIETGELPERVQGADRSWLQRFRSNFIDAQATALDAWQNDQRLTDALRLATSKGNEANRQVRHQYDRWNENVVKAAKELKRTPAAIINSVDGLLRGRAAIDLNADLVAKHQRVIDTNERTIAENAPPQPEGFMDPAQYEAAKASWDDGKGPEAIAAAQRAMAESAQWLQDYGRVRNKVRTAEERTPGHADAIKLAGGLTDAEGMAILNKLRETYGDNIKVIEDLAQQSLSPHNQQRDALRSEGYYSDADADNWSASPWWVPTRGVQSRAEGGDPRSPRMTGDFAVPKEYERAGRISLSDSPTKLLWDDAQRMALMRGNTDFIRTLAEQGGQYGFRVVPQGHPQDGVALRYAVQNPDAPEGPSVTARGKIVHDNPEVIAALRGLDREGSGHPVIDNMAKYTRLFGWSVTRGVPAFAIVNGPKDFFERALNIRALSNENVNISRMMSRFPIDYMPAVRQIWKTLRTGQPVGEWGQRFTEARDQGGILTKNRAILTGDDTRINNLRNFMGGRDKFRRFLDGLHDWNEAWEAAAQTLIYNGLKEQGFTPKKAAALTLGGLDLNIKGNYAGWANALYPFFATRAQGGAQLTRSLTTPRGMAQFGAQVGAGLLLYELSRAMGGDQEDIGNRTDAVSQAGIQRSIPIWMGDSYFRLPVPYGSSFLAWNTAVALARRARGQWSTSDAIEHIGTSYLDETSPAGTPPPADPRKQTAYFLSSMLMPEFGKRLFNVAAEKNAFGGELNRPNINPAMPRSEQGRKTTPQLWKDFAKGLNSTLGVDRTPEEIREILSTFMPQLQQMTTEAERDDIGGGVVGVAKTLTGAPRLWTTPRNQLQNVFYERFNNVQDNISSMVAQYGPIPDAETSGVRSPVARAQLYAQQNGLSPQQARLIVAYETYKSENRRKGSNQEDAMRNFLRSLQQ